MKNSAISKMVAQFATEFGTEGNLEFNRPLRVIKTDGNLNVVGVTKGITFDNEHTPLVRVEDPEDGTRFLYPFSLLSFTDRLRVLRRCARHTEKIVRDK